MIESTAFILVGKEGRRSLLAYTASVAAAADRLRRRRRLCRRRRAAARRARPLQPLAGLFAKIVTIFYLKSLK